MKIVWRAKPNIFLSSYLKHFLYKHETYVHPNYALDNKVYSMNILKTSNNKKNFSNILIVNIMALFIECYPSLCGEGLCCFFCVWTRRGCAWHQAVPICFSVSVPQCHPSGTWICALGKSRKYLYLFSLQIILPISSFHRLAEKVGDPTKPVGLVHMTARSGSTLLAQLMSR